MKPTNKTQLLRFLADNPYLRWTHPGFGKAQVHSNFGTSQHPASNPKTEPRKFRRVQGGRLVFLTVKGTDSYLQVTAKQLSFDDNGFNVAFSDDWKDMAGKSMRYEYIDETTYHAEIPAVTTGV